MNKHTTLVDVLHHHATTKKNELLYRFIEDGDSPAQEMSFFEVDYAARAIASELLQTCKKGERALLLYPAGIEFITAFLGCLYAGVIAVPAYPPRKNQKIKRLEKIINDAQASIILTVEKSAVIAKPLFNEDAELSKLPWFETDAKYLKEPSAINVKLKSDDIAFLQYTSGSTGEPKGVMVTHGNIMSNMEFIYQSFSYSDETVFVSWLPTFHDMGLIGGVLSPLYGGFSTTLMSPVYFLQKPLRWLEIISKYKATVSGGPNFAYDLCTDTIKDEELHALDLSSWKVAFNGAEPIHASTLSKFSKKFENCGFKADSHYPCYGMAETTLIIAGGKTEDAPVILNVNQEALQEGSIKIEKNLDLSQEMISSGYSWLGHETLIVDTQSHTQVAKGEVGEIWARGESVALGYWRDKEKTDTTFNAYVKESQEGPFLRTGDLGFFYEGQLFICGRVKDLLIIRGRNYYPQDIEELVSDSNEALSANACAAFSVTVDNQEQLIIVQEVKRTYVRQIDVQKVFSEIRTNVSVALELQVSDIILLRPGQLLKTSSGKIQRQANKKAYESQGFKVLASYKEECVGTDEQIEDFSLQVYQTLHESKKKEYISLHLKASLSQLSNISAQNIQENQNLLALGLDSLRMTQLLAELQTVYFLEMNLELLFELKSVENLLNALKQSLDKQALNSLSPVKRKAVLSRVVQDKRDKAPLSFAQERLWFIDQLETASADYNAFEALRIFGDLDISKVEKSFNLIIERHENLRTVFPSLESSAQQKVLKDLDFKVKTFDLRTQGNSIESKLKELCQDEVTTPFDLSQGPLIRVIVMILKDDEHVLLINTHHIISDGHSMAVLIKEFSQFMNALSSGKEVKLPELKFQYIDYTFWQRESLKEEGKLEKHLEYWENELSPFPRQLNLSLLKEKNVQKPTAEVKTIFTSINQEQLHKINHIRIKNSWTINQIFLALYASLIYRYTQQDSIIIAVPNANRPLKETQDILGFFINTMLIRLDLEDSSSYADITNQTRSKLLSALEHQDAPLQNIVERLRLKESSLDVEDIQFAFNSLEENSFPKDGLTDLRYEAYDVGVDSAKTLINLSLNVKENSIEFSLTYKSSLLSDAKVEKFLSHYSQLIEEFCSDADELPILAPIFNQDVIKHSPYTQEQVQDVYPLTQMQIDLYLQGQMHFQNRYFMGLIYEVEEHLQLDVFQKAISHVVSKIETLNLRVSEYAGQLYQLSVNDNNEGLIVKVESKEGEDARSAVFRASDASISFEKGPLIKAIFVYKDSKLTHISYMAHHVILDGVSMVYFRALVDKAYKNYSHEKAFINIDVKTSTQEISSLIKKYKHKQQSELWAETLSEVNDIPVFNPLNLGKQKLEDLFLDKAVITTLNQIKRDNDISLLSLINAVYVGVLYRLFNITDDFILYETLSGRKSLKEFSFGVYADVRPIVIKKEWFKQDFSLVNLAQKIQDFQENKTDLISMQAQSKLIKNSKIAFSTNFMPRLSKMHGESMDTIPSNEVQLNIVNGNPYTIRFIYPENVFNGLDIREKFSLVVQSLLESSKVKIADIDFLSQQERDLQLKKLNQTQVQYRQEKTVHQLFEQQAKSRQNHTAIVCGDKSLTYKELNEKANQLAYHLIDLGVKADSLVAICLDRSLDMIVALLAVLKSGGAYVPIDASYPSDRVAYILNDSQASLFITDSTLQKKMPKTKAEEVLIDSLRLDTYKKTDISTKTQVDNLAYVIYTSGSTGKPKGVMVEHKNVERLFKSSEKNFAFNETDVWTLFHSFAFDFAVWEIWGALLHGGKLIIVPSEVSRSTEDFYTLLHQEGVTVLNQTPSAFQQLISIDRQKTEKLQSLRKVVFGGEKLNFNLLKPWYEKYSDTSPELINMYGITETTVHVTYNALRKEDVREEKSLIGSVLDDLCAYVLDANEKLVPIGLPGELHVSGEGLARGYLNQKELTQEKFVVNPFKADTKMYKTGDLVRYTDAGNLEYLGRIDEQVKIRGFRIELGEIEQNLLKIDTVKESTVLVKENAEGDKSLVAYLVMTDHQELNQKNIKQILSQDLPEYMIPMAFIKVETMPLTSNGKVDKKTLEKLELVIESNQAYIAPRNQVEEKLAILFSELLSTEKVGVHDNFFDLGGHSLLAVSLVSKINKKFDTALTVAALFKFSTIEELAIMLNNEKEHNFEITVAIQTKGERLPLFAIPGAGGNVAMFEPLSRVFGKTQPFYGFQSIGLDGVSPLPESIEEIAAQNIQEMKKIQSKGPYHLIGHSIGGVIAYEMSRQLKDEETKVILLDSHAPSSLKTIIDRTDKQAKTKYIYELYQLIIDTYKFESTLSLEALYEVDEEDQLAFIVQSLAKNEIEFTAEQFEVFVKVYKNNILCMQNYAPKSVPENIDIALIRASLRDSKVADDYDWNALLSSNIKLYESNGDHYSILAAENVEELSLKICSYYDSLNHEIFDKEDFLHYECSLNEVV